MAPPIRWNIRGFRELRCSQEVENYLHDKAVLGARAAGDGFLARANTGRNRARAAVIAVTIRARRRNARDHTLVGPVIDAMRSQ
ncbi:hypothetical protein [Nocardia sp. NPDC019255]|uniref:hypothetical protein n=1 Tax=Nocardia sp. NPDC019255 TaxID=3154591 RepID=UPI0033D5BB5A